MLSSCSYGKPCKASGWRHLYINPFNITNIGIAIVVHLALLRGASTRYYPAVVSTRVRNERWCMVPHTPLHTLWLKLRALFSLQWSIVLGAVYRRNLFCKNNRICSWLRQSKSRARASESGWVSLAICLLIRLLRASAANSDQQSIDTTRRRRRRNCCGGCCNNAPQAVAWQQHQPSCWRFSY